MDVWIQLFSHAVIGGAVYALIASGLSFIYTTTRVFHFAHGGVIAFCAYVFWWLARVEQWNMILSGLATVVVGVVLGLLINELVYEPLRRRHAKSFSFLVATIAVLLFFSALILALFSANTRTMAITTTVYDLAGARVSVLQMVLVSCAVLLLCGLGAFVRWTKFGKAMRATADNEMVSEVLGIRTRVIRRLSVAMGSLLGACAAIFLALEFNLDPNMGVMAILKGFTAVVVGGLGSLPGTLLGSGVLSALEQGAVWHLGGEWRNAVAFSLLFLFLLFRPNGLLGRKRF